MTHLECPGHPLQRRGGVDFPEPGERQEEAIDRPPGLIGLATGPAHWYRQCIPKGITLQATSVSSPVRATSGGAPPLLGHGRGTRETLWRTFRWMHHTKTGERWCRTASVSDPKIRATRLPAMRIREWSPNPFAHRKRQRRRRTCRLPFSRLRPVVGHLIDVEITAMPARMRSAPRQRQGVTASPNNNAEATSSRM